MLKRARNENQPSLNEVPVGQVLLFVVRIGRTGPVYEIEIDVVQAQALKRRVNALGNAVVPGVVELGGDPDLLAGNARIADTITNLCLIAISQGTAIMSIHVPRIAIWTFYYNSRVDVSVAPQKRVLHGLANLIGLGLPGTKTNSRDLGPSVEGESLPVKRKLIRFFNAFCQHKTYVGCYTYLVWRFDILRIRIGL